MTGYRHDEVQTALRQALPWVLVNMNDDGEFVFRRGESFVYGHERMSSRHDKSVMFAIWFRTLSLAYLSRVVDDSDLRKVNWKFVDCPGLQFWNL